MSSVVVVRVSGRGLRGSVVGCEVVGEVVIVIEADAALAGGIAGDGGAAVGALALGVALGAVRMLALGVALGAVRMLALGVALGALGTLAVGSLGAIAAGVA